MSFEFRPLRDREAGMGALKRISRGEPPRRTLAERMWARLTRVLAWIRGGHWPS